ncbi:LPS assembly protein LptD [Accumulibacter sp.]|uniref:LPS assembly protein LptD n=1 Tax=Accumulibacter sp. TaxID=2053492 RepID=UPI0035B2A2A8
MTFPFRRKPRTLIFRCAVATTLLASLPGVAQAQPAPPLRVDPALLGLPAIAPALPVKRSPAGQADGAPAESKPVVTPVIEARPVPTPTTAEEPVQAAVEVSEQPSAEGVSSPAANVGPDVQAGKALARDAEQPVISQPDQGRAEPLAETPKASAPGAETAAPSALSASPATTIAVPPPAEQAAPSVEKEAPSVISTPSPVPVKPAGVVAEVPSSSSPASATPPAEAETGSQATFLSAQRISGVVDRELIAQDDAELRQADRVLTADQLTYWPVEDEVEAVGSARFQQRDDVVSGTKMRMRLEDHFGFFDDASYFVKRPPRSAAGAKSRGDVASGLAPTEADSEFSGGFAAPMSFGLVPGQTKLKYHQDANGEPTEARGTAQRIDFEGENQIRLSSATYTTCKPGNDDWFLSVADLKLDYDNEVGSGNDATIHFLGVPILYSPWLSFSLNNHRKSGFLTPRYGSSSDSGFEFTLPYYWNIAPNMDATFEPTLLTKRGLLLGTDFRYLNAAYGGTYVGNVRGEYLPNDRVANRDRWGVALTHSQVAANGFSGAINYNRVSDSDYYTDLSSEITKTSETQLLQQGLLSYGGGGWWNATANVQTFQTLQPDPQNPVTPPYQLLPQITVNARQPDLLSTDSAFFGQYTSFVRPDSSTVDGQRTVVQPQISLPYITPGWYVTPRVGVNVTHYALNYPGSTNVLPTSINRNLPIFSVDSGMTFERPSNWFGRDYTQTLEPRLYYLNIPYENQDDIPIFDTALADFNFAQIFADNQFSGWDRINNANQLTAALSSRLINPASGNEIMRGMVGQRLYFTKDKVALPGATTRQWDRSDFLAGFTGQILPRVYADAALQYTVDDQEFQRYSFGARYFPEAGKLLNASYSYNTQAVTPIKQVDVSGQWPIDGRWQAVGRYNYSFLQNQPIEIIGGLEYNAGCWVVRVVGQRLQTTEADATTRAFVQLELSDFSRLGSNPISLLQRRIPGYGVANQPQTDSALAEQ